MKYFDELVRLSQLTLQEKNFERKQFEEFLSSKSVHERKLTGKCVFPIHLNQTNFGVSGYVELVFEVDHTTNLDQFSVGSTVSIFKSSDNIKSEVLANASIKAVKKDKITLLVRADNEPNDLDEHTLGIDLTPDNRSYQVMEHTLNSLINSEDQNKISILKKMWGDTEVNANTRDETFNSPKLNEWQNQGVRLSMVSEDFTALHGPPGTGKTTTLVQCIKQTVKAEGKTLVTANSNAAVDHLVKCLLKEGVTVVRIGNVVKIDDDVLSSQIDIKIQGDRDYKLVKELKKRALDLRKKAEKFKRSFNAEDRQNRRAWYQESRDLIKESRETEKYLIDKVINNSQVIATTLIGSDSEILRSQNFKTAFIDEAAQALIPAALTPFKRAEKLVLAGDPFQLPPLVKDAKAASAGLDKSLLEVIMENSSERTVKLRIQYRMDESIMAFSNEKFYENELEAHDSVKSHGFIADGLCPIEFIDTSGCGFDEEFSKSGRSLSNEKEADIVKSRLEESKLSFENMSVGVISPYRGQVNVLKDLLTLEDNQVNTVDAFQGQERDVIVLSLVRSNEENIIGFLKDYRRMNVAMTRARKKLIIIGDSSTVGSDPFYVDLLEFIEKRGSYRTAWEYATY